MGLIFTTADWRGQICDGFRQPRIRPAQRSTQRSVGTVSLSSCVPRRWWVEDRALWHQTVLDVTPKGDRQLARNSDDQGLPHARALTCSALKKPSGECALRLMPDPQPCGLDHNGPHVATARSRNPLAALLLAAAVGAWGEAQKASHLPPVGKLAVIEPHAKARLRSPAQCFSVVTGDDACARSPRRVSAPCLARARSWQSAPAPWQASGFPARPRRRVEAANDDHLRSRAGRLPRFCIGI